MKSRFLKKTSAVILVTLFSVTYVTDVHAYELYGGRYTQDIYSQKYYNDAPTYSSVSGMNHSLPFESSISDWNATQNTKVWWVKTTVKSESILDLTVQSSSDPKLYGYTEHYIGNTRLTYEEVGDKYWYWAKCWTNLSADWSINPIYPYQIKAYKMQWATAHEIGHAMGFDHAGEDPGDYHDQVDKLMYSSPHAYMERGVYKPTADEVAGIQKLYGKLY